MFKAWGTTNFRWACEHEKNPDRHRIMELELQLGIAVDKLESFKETGGVWNESDEPDLAAMQAALEGHKHEPVTHSPSIERQGFTLGEEQIKHMVNRFLGWKVPDDFGPDGGISFKPTHHDGTPWPKQWWPTGMSILTAIQAEAMLRYILEGMPPSDLVQRNEALEKEAHQLHIANATFHEWDRARKFAEEAMASWAAKPEDAKLAIVDAVNALYMTRLALVESSADSVMLRCWQQLALEFYADLKKCQADLAEVDRAFAGDSNPLQWRYAREDAVARIAARDKEPG